MSMFDTPNKDAVFAGGEATGGESRNFIEATRDAYNASFKAMSQLGVEGEYSRLEYEQNQRIEKRGGKLPVIEGSSLWHQEAARFYENGGTPETAARLAKYDAQLMALRNDHPDVEIQSSRELWDRVKDEAQKAEEVAAGPGSGIGHFLGEAAASIDPRVNPFNFATLPIGGAGKTVVGRIAMAGASQGVIQGVNELTGVGENRRLLGLETGIGDSLHRIGTAAVAGGLIHGGIEGIGALGRRVIGSPVPELPPQMEKPSRVTGGAANTLSELPPREQPLFRDFDGSASLRAKQDIEGSVLATTQYVAGSSPYGKSRLAVARHERDIEHVEAQMQDFRRDGPLRISSTDTAVPAHVTTSELVTPHWLKTGDVRVPELARATDPELFTHLDKLEMLAQREREVLRGSQSARAKLPLADVDAALAKADALEVKIADLQAQIPGADVRKVKKLQGKIAKFEKEQRETIDAISPEDMAPVVGNENAIREASQNLASIEREMMELAPLRKRAESAGLEQYQAQRIAPETFNAFNAQLRKELNLFESDGESLAASRRPSEKLTKEQGGDDVAPGTPKRPGTTSGPDPTEPLGSGNSAERLLRDVSHANANADEVVTAAFDAAQKVKDGHTGEIVLGNKRYALDDQIPINVTRDANGVVTGVETITARDLLKEIGDDADMLAAMRSCSV